MKIYKSNLAALLDEVDGPVWLHKHSKTSVSKDERAVIPWTTFILTIAGFNREGRVCELAIATAAQPSMMLNSPEGKEIQDKFHREADDARERLVKLEREVRDGCISDTPIYGGLE